MSSKLNYLLLKNSEGTFIEGLVKDYLRQNFADTNNSIISKSKPYILYMIVLMVISLFGIVFLGPYLIHTLVMSFDTSGNSMAALGIVYVFLMAVYVIFAIPKIIAILLFILALFIGLFL
jgi:hypothetical protein